MDSPSQALIPTRDEIIYTNRVMIERFGGYLLTANNLSNPNALDYILEAVQFALAGVDRFPRLLDKAAALAWHIITRHIFHDGNECTGLEVCRAMLALNGIQMQMSLDAVDVAVQIATNAITFEAFVAWLEGTCGEVTSSQMSYAN